MSVSVSERGEEERGEREGEGERKRGRRGKKLRRKPQEGQKREVFCLSCEIVPQTFAMTSVVVF